MLLNLHSLLQKPNCSWWNLALRQDIQIEFFEIIYLILKSWRKPTEFLISSFDPREIELNTIFSKKFPWKWKHKHALYSTGLRVKNTTCFSNPHAINKREWVSKNSPSIHRNEYNTEMYTAGKNLRTKRKR